MSKDQDSKRQRIFEAAGPLFERFGYKKTTVEEICQAAGMSKRTFYELFQDKADLFMEITQDGMNRAAEQWEEDLPPDMDPLGRLNSLIDYYPKMITEYPSFRVIIEEPDLWRKFSEKLDEIRFIQIGGTVHTILKEGVAEGQFREMDTHIAIWLIFSLLDTVYLLMPGLMDVPGALDNPALAEETKQFILWGLGAVPADDRRR